MKRKLKNKIQKYLPIVSIIFGGLLFLGILSYIGFQGDSIQQNRNEKNKKLQYVLVNEDKGTFFEGKQYSLGTDFVTLINQDVANRWETTTRDIANRGVAGGQFDAQIIIPQDFSERLLSLQSVNPEKALVEYQVREGQNEITNQRIQVKVNDILQDFNQRIIQMYFSSIVGNLSEAQRNVNQMVGLEIAHKDDLEQSIYLPFKTVPTNFSNVIDTASILDEDNKMFTAEQKVFVASVKSMMTSNNTELEANSQLTEEVQKSVNDYADNGNEKLTTVINQFNEQFELQKSQLEKQWQSDVTGYKGQHDIFDNSIKNQLAMFFAKGTGETQDSGVYAEFLTNALVFKETQSQRKSELMRHIENLEDQVSKLTELKEEIAQKYYNDPSANPESADEKEIKQAIINLMSEIEKVSGITEDSGYLTAVSDELEELQNLPLPSEADFSLLLEKLLNKGLLTDDVRDKLEASYYIAIRYDPSLTGNGNQLNLLTTPTSEDVSSDFTVTNTVALELTPDSKQTLDFSYELSLESSGNVEITNLEAIQENLEEALSAKLVDSDYAAVVVRDGTKITISIILKEVEGEQEEEPALPKETQMSYTFESKLSWTYSNDVSDANQYYQSQYFWHLNDKKASSGYLAIYMDKDLPLKEDLPELFSLFTILTSVAEKLTTIYADPDYIEVRDFSSYLLDNPEETLADLATPDSVFWLYNNLSDEKNSLQISETLFENYRINGRILYEKVEVQINNLLKTIGTASDKNEGQKITLYGTLNLMTLPDMMLEEASELGDWFLKADREIETTYRSWSETERVAAESVITKENVHPEKNDTTAINNTTENLVKSIQTLASNSKEITKVTEESAAQVKDVAPIIKTLQDSTDKVKTETTDVLSNLDQTVIDLSDKTIDNTQYAENFSKVLANTKDGGADNQRVFNFLARPIQEKGDFGKTRQISLIPYYATLIAAIMMILFATSLQNYMKQRKVSKADWLIKPSRAWYNLSNVSVILISSVTLAAGFALNLSLVVGTSAKIAWFSYAFLMLLAGLLLTLGCMRQFKLLTLYMSGAILGLFFMLTPLLGVATKNGTVTNLLYRVSPLQNIQNGFTALQNGGSVGWLSYLILIVLVLSGILLNFWVKPANKKIKA